MEGNITRTTSSYKQLMTFGDRSREPSTSSHPEASSASARPLIDPSILIWDSELSTDKGESR